ncbi:MAG: hypothetical protein HFJ27_03530 [Clostridia bacterium]|nr:hypothetical protein [Clostridia bacterium]
MVKNVQLKIILIFTILTTILITGISLYFLTYLQDINIQVLNDQSQEIITNQNKIEQGTLLTIYAIFGFCLISVVISVFVTAKVTNPINKLITSAKRIAAGEEVEIKKIEQQEDKQVNELVDAFRTYDYRIKGKFK